MYIIVHILTHIVTSHTFYEYIDPEIEILFKYHTAHIFIHWCLINDWN